VRASSASTAARLPHRPPRSSHPSDRRDLDVCASAAGHRVFTLPSPAGASIVRMSSTHAFTGRSLVGDFESEYDEFDRDADTQVPERRDGWLEPSW